MLRQMPVLIVTNLLSSMVLLHFWWLSMLIGLSPAFGQRALPVSLPLCPVGALPLCPSPRLTPRRPSHQRPATNRGTLCLTSRGCCLSSQLLNGQLHQQLLW